MWKFEPILKQTLWGGNAILPYKRLPATMERVGESWELSAVRGDESVVAEGPDKGRTVTALLEEHKGALTGAANYRRFGNTFPLLVKFIDARQQLSIQVHPDDRLAMQRHGKRGKTEMWYVVKAGEGASLYAGFSRPVTPDEYEARVLDGTLTEVLRQYEVREGDVFFLPAGRVHSIGAGCFVAEIQETSDLTYRIFDFNRRDAEGRPRELHTELAKAAIDYTVLPDYRTHYEAEDNQRTELADCPYFTTNLFRLDRPVAPDYTGLDSFVLYMGIEGEADIKADGETARLRAGETLLLPATTGRTGILPQGKATLLEIYIGKKH